MFNTNGPQRLKDMKLMQKDPNALDKARKAEQRANEKSGLITIKPLKLEVAAKKGGFKKGGFKSAFAPAGAAAPANEEKAEVAKIVAEPKPDAMYDSEDDIGYDYYDPRKPTGCNGECGFKGS